MNGIVIKQYRSRQSYAAGIDAMARQGYQATNVVIETPRSGCMRIILTGGLGLFIWKPKPVFTTTFERK